MMSKSKWLQIFGWADGKLSISIQPMILLLYKYAGRFYTGCHATVRFSDLTPGSVTLESSVRNIKVNVFDLHILTIQQNLFVLATRLNFGEILDFQAG